MITKTLGEICDECSIATLKIQRLPALPGTFHTRFEELVNERNLQFEILRKKGLKPDELYAELHEANSAIWNLESDMRTLKIRKWFANDDLYIEMGKRADSIRAINAIRVKYKNLINDLAGDLQEQKGDHLSQ